MCAGSDFPVEEADPRRGLHAAVLRQERDRKHLRLMVNELNHRVKNTLATVQSIVAQTLRSAEWAGGQALLAAPDVDTPLGLRDRTMLELMYASGLRVSELVGMKVFNLGRQENVVRILGKGGKERLVPFGVVASDWIERYLKEARPARPGGESSPRWV